MGSKKMQKSLDTVKADVRELAEAFWALRDEIMTQQATSAAEEQSSRTQRPFTPLPISAADVPEGSAGYVDAHGIFTTTSSTGVQRTYRWAAEQHPVEDLLAVSLDESAKVLGAIGHKQRLRILLHLLHSPSTANEIVQQLALGTTGAAYHHLNVLQGAGLVDQEQRGTFSIIPDRVPALFSILIGLSGALRVDVEAITQESTDAAGKDLPTA